MTTNKKKGEKVSVEEKVKIAYRNGYNKGLTDGCKEGHRHAFEEITQQLENVLHWRKGTRVADPLPAYCRGCLISFKK